MSVDIDSLRLLLAAGTPTPWCVHRDGNNGIGASCTKYNIGDFEFESDEDLAVAAVNALPKLLAVFEAACQWRDVEASGPEGTRQTCAALSALLRAVDSARGDA